jgi:hypothetical protein
MPGQRDVDAAHLRELGDIMREHNCSPDEAARIQNERQLAEVEDKLAAMFGPGIKDAATVEQAAKTMAEHRRELMLELPWHRGLWMARQHLAHRRLIPRQRGRCERRPAVRRSARRSTAASRDGPSDPSDLDPPPRAPLPEGVAA